MDFFRNFLVVILTVGLVTRLFFYIFRKRMDGKSATYVAFLTASLFLIPFYLSFGFDVVIVEFLPAFFFWLGFDLLRLNVKREK
jgi:4-hydroxybenzoate polyprenyltransferase